MSHAHAIAPMQLVSSCCSVSGAVTEVSKGMTPRQAQSIIDQAQPAPVRSCLVRNRCMDAVAHRSEW